MKSFLVLGSALSLASALCDHGTHLNPRAEHGIKVATFGFNELDGPLNWHGLNQTNSQCALGHNQSPINIEPSKVNIVRGSSLEFELETYLQGAEFENLGSTVEVIAEGTLLREGKEYALKQFHFHTPSEHRVNSEYYPMEVHFVFQAEDSSLSVVGFLIEVGRDWEASPFLRSVFRHVEEIEEPGTATETGPLHGHELSRLLGESEVYQYSGSLTTPPCTEGIAWNVVKDPLYIDVHTYRRVKRIMKFNSRYTQDNPNTINLLDNARKVLDTQGASGADL